MIFLTSSGSNSLIISPVFGSAIRLTTYGLYNFPPLIAADTAVICWIAVTLIPWPKAEVANSTGPTLSKLNKIPFPSPFKSIPVFLPKPKLLIYLNNLSFPNLFPKDTNPGLLSLNIRTPKMSIFIMFNNLFISYISIKGENYE